MTRKMHLKHSQFGGPTCQRGRVGGSLRGEHLSEGFDDFVERSEELQCARCVASPLFGFLQRQQAKSLAEWEPEAPDAWKAADDALVAARRAA